MMKILSNKSGSSPYSRKALIVLEEKGLTYEQHNVDPEYLPVGFGTDLNPNLRVSVLIDGEKTIFESDNIVDYLLRNYPDKTAPNAPSPPLSQSMTRADHHIDDAMVLVTIETLINSAVNIVLFSLSDADPQDIRPWGWVWARDPQRIHSCLEWLDRKATPEGFAPGVFSIMDLKLMCALSALSSMTNENWEQYKNLALLHDYYSTRPSIIKTDPDRQ